MADPIPTPPAVLIPIGPHLFTPEALTAAVSKAMANVPAGKQNVVQGTVDSDGAQVVLAFGSKDGAFKLELAMQHDWKSNNKFGASGSYAW